MTTDMTEYLRKKGVNKNDIINDYVVNGMSAHSITTKYHSSKNRIIELLKQENVLRNKSTSVKAHVVGSNENIKIFMSLSDDILINFAKKGFSSHQVCNLFIIASTGNMVKQRLKDVEYDKYWDKFQYKKPHNNSRDPILNYLKTIPDNVWDLLFHYYTVPEICEYFNVSKGFMEKYLTKNKRYTASLWSFVGQNFSDNRELGTWVYQSFKNPMLLRHLLLSFPSMTYVDMSNYFQNSVSSTHKILNGLNINLHDDKIGSTYEEMVFNKLQEFYDGEILRYNRKILDGYELDFYLPDDKVAIEVSPSETHSSSNHMHRRSLSSSYHMNKRMKCMEQGINLITMPDTMLTDKFISNSFPIMIKQFTGQIDAHIDSYKAFEMDREQFNDIIGNFGIAMRISSNVSHIIKIVNGKNTNNTIAYCTVGKYGLRSLNDAIKIIDIISPYALDMDKGLMKSIIDFIYSKYSHTTIYATTGKFIGTGEYYRYCGFKYLRTTRPRPYYYDIKHKGSLPIIDMKKSNIDRTEKESYAKMYDCGSGVFIYKPDNKMAGTN